MQLFPNILDQMTFEIMFFFFFVFGDLIVLFAPQVMEHGIGLW